MGNKKATGFLCLRLVPCFAYVGAEDNRKGIPFVKIVSLLCKLIQFLMVALSVTVHKALILLVFLNHPYQILAFMWVFGICFYQCIRKGKEGIGYAADKRRSNGVDSGWSVK